MAPGIAERSSAIQIYCRVLWVDSLTAAAFLYGVGHRVGGGGGGVVAGEARVRDIGVVLHIQSVI